ncbi:hypothetical protein DFH08DRAFT_798334 [Mycena albidolilacea]|uniref:CxC5 like cysteine cluster associated with KDZ domain-containing protein n=1 Tax=Mycena albidolilacea TaxID=1033008 RepID=A0AAD7ANC1_9AGAR|nr:hypothetical protein DFH08DRAFT_798334 [Mycena albidolilacea]
MISGIVGGISPNKQAKGIKLPSTASIQHPARRAYTTALFSALRHDTDLQDLSFTQISTAICLLPAPSHLPPSIHTFVSEAVGILYDQVPKLWSCLKGDIWALSGTKLSPAEQELFRVYGWRQGLMALTLYPLTHHCSNPDCSAEGPLKKAELCEIIVYTQGEGAVPAHAVHLYCRGCKTNYHHNYSVQGGIRQYYGDTPQYIQIGEHQFAECKLAPMAQHETYSSLSQWAAVVAKSHCTTELASNWHCFCPVHRDLNNVCSIVGCDVCIVLGKKSCADPAHQKVKELHFQRGKAVFTLREHLQKHRQLHPHDQATALEEDEANKGLDDEGQEWFVEDGDGNVAVHQQIHPGSIDDSALCEAVKSDTSNCKYKVLFGGVRAHNEQILVRPCGVICSREEAPGALLNHSWLRP